MSIKGLARLCVLALLIGAPWYALRSGAIVVPNEWNPWAPLKLEEPLNWLTRYKLARVSGDDALCLALLEQSGMRFDPLPDRAVGGGCGFRNAVRVRATSAAVGEPFTLSCRSAVSLALWERHVLQPASRIYFDAPVARIEHFGSYACRNIYGRSDAPLSRHATADAFDVAGFVTATGLRVRVERDWGSASREGLFLRHVHEGACRVFDTVLGPGYNASHGDHFHFDRGGHRICR